ncbi:prickle-like protein 4 isoform X2 [Carettochelys insculpta]|uniref:prickle-like protein 4 isoform X2 n=1 Tax=Carettochelys insculpta TaxID=44489 RepID=UPI003EB7464D
MFPFRFAEQLPAAQPRPGLRPLQQVETGVAGQPRARGQPDVSSFVVAPAPPRGEEADRQPGAGRRGLGQPQVSLPADVSVKPCMAPERRTSCSRPPAGVPPNSSSDSDSGCALEEYPAAAVDAAPAQVPLCFHSLSADTVPAAIQRRLRVRSLLQQLPPQDCDCGKRLNTGDLGVFAAQLGDRSCWHPSCFVCHSCHQPLVDLIYFHQDGKIYCGRHHAELFWPRCASCDQLIFTEQCTEAEARCWHTEHFCCLECDLPLGGQRYVMKGGRPCCCSCFEGLYAELCQACGELIGVDSEQATHQGRHWHARASCFCCSLCRKALLGQPVTSHHGLLFCSEACHLEKAAVSSTASDSSDSAFVSAPSPDSTPVSRASSEGSRNTPRPGGSPPAPAMGGNSRKQNAEAHEMDDCPHPSCMCPAFGSQPGHGAAFQERSKGTSYPHALGEVAAASLGPEQFSASLPSQPVQEGSGPWGDQLAGSGRAQHFRISPSPDPSSASRQRLVPPDGTEEGDCWCPTCSSSSDSDSEQEGFFLGRPIPRVGAACPALPGSAVGRRARLRGSSKHCSIS